MVAKQRTAFGLSDEQVDTFSRACFAWRGQLRSFGRQVSANAAEAHNDRSRLFTSPYGCAQDETLQGAVGPLYFLGIGSTGTTTIGSLCTLTGRTPVHARRAVVACVRDDWPDRDKRERLSH